MNPLACTEREPQLEALLFDELDPTDQLTLGTHVEHCAGCRDALKDARAGFEALADLSDAPLPYDASL